MRYSSLFMVLFILCGFAMAGTPESITVNDFIGLLNNSDSAEMDIMSRDARIQKLDDMLKQLAEYNNYSEWFLHTFWPEFDRAEPIITNSSREKLEYLLKIKPDFAGIGVNYNLFFDKFSQLLSRYEPVLTNSQRDSLKILGRAKPSLDGSEQHYNQFIEVFSSYIDRYEPVLTGSQKEVLRVLQEVKPESSQISYQRWLRLYNFYYEKYSPVITTSQREVLDFIESVMPDTTPDDDEVEFSISREKLLELKYFINTNRLNRAIYEIDQILNQQVPLN